MYIRVQRARWPEASQTISFSQALIIIIIIIIIIITIFLYWQPWIEQPPSSYHFDIEQPICARTSAAPALQTLTLLIFSSPSVSLSLDDWLIVRWSAIYTTTLLSCSIRNDETCGHSALLRPCWVWPPRWTSSRGVTMNVRPIQGSHPSQRAETFPPISAACSPTTLSAALCPSTWGSLPSLEAWGIGTMKGQCRHVAV